MKALLVVLAVAAIVGLAGLSTFPRSSEADSPLKGWGPLSETCRDVSGDGYVDLANDILGVILVYGAQWGDDDYALLYDQNGDGVVDLANDILATIQAFGQTCDVVERQVIASAAAILRYRDCQDAVADGYDPSGLYVTQMGIHISKPSNLKTTFDPNNWDDLANPFGLVCSRSADDQYKPDKLIGPWYIVPVENTAHIYNTLFGTNITPPYQPDDVPPPGFDTDEDFIPWVGIGSQAGWHTHTNLCVGFDPHRLHEQGPAGTQQSCQSIGGQLNIPLFGWMLHLYNFVPNPDGRFMRWNINPDFPYCGYSSISNWPSC